MVRKVGARVMTETAGRWTPGGTLSPVSDTGIPAGADLGGLAVRFTGKNACATPGYFFFFGVTFFIFLPNALIVVAAAVPAPTGPASAGSFMRLITSC